MTAMNPQITKSYAAGELYEMNKLVCRGARISYFLMFTISLPVMFEAYQILYLWLGLVPEYTVTFFRLSMIAAMITLLGQTGVIACMAAVPYNVSIPYGILDLDGRNIKGLLEKPKYNYYANAGIYLIKRRTLEMIPDETFFNATDLVEKLIVEGKKVIRYPLNGTWIDIGNHQEY